MRELHHPEDLGRQLHAESIRWQQHLADVPLPEEPRRDHPVLRDTALVMAALVVVALCWVLLPPALGS